MAATVFRHFTFSAAHRSILCLSLLRGTSIFSLPSSNIKNSRFCCSHSAVVTFEQVREGLNDGSLVLIDVREPKELKEDGRIPKAHNIPLGELDAAFKMNAPAFTEKYSFQKPEEQDDNIAVSCRSGKRAASGMEILKKLNYDNIKLYAGSFLDWVKNDGPVLKD